jgi:DNA-binding response OmpR family regulator
MVTPIRSGLQTEILLVEDEELVALSVRIALSEVGVNAVCAASAEQARLLLSAMTFSGAIIDVGLPDVRGDQLAREFRLLKPTLPILLCTGFDAANYAVGFQDDPCVRVIEKPYDEPYLFAQLRLLGILLEDWSSPQFVES